MASRKLPPQNESSSEEELAATRRQETSSDSSPERVKPQRRPASRKKGSSSNKSSPKQRRPSSGKKGGSSDESPVRIITRKSITPKKGSPPSKTQSSFSRPEKKILEEKVLPLEDIINIVGDMIAPFLTDEEKVNLTTANSELNTYPMSLDLSPYKMSYDDFISYFGKRPQLNLTGLNIAFSELDIDLTPLFPFLRRLKTLTIHDESGYNFGLGIIAHCKELTVLNLNVDKTNLTPLVNCPNLTRLIIYNGAVAGVDSLAKIPSLKFLGVYNARVVTEKAERNPFDFLSSLRNIDKLELSSISTLTKLPSLAGCSNLRTFIVAECKNLANISGLEDCTHLTTVEINSCGQVKNFNPLASCTGLISAHFVAGPPTADGVETELKINLLANAPNLKNLVISNFILRDDSSFLHWKALRALHLDQIQGDLQIPALPAVIKVGGQKVSGLETLHLYGSTLDDLKDLDMCEELREIKLINCTALHNVGFIGYCEHLTRLEITNCPIDSFQFLGNCRDLTHLTLTHIPLYELEVLKYHTKITHLNLSDTNLTSMSDFAMCSRLKELNLNGTLVRFLDLLGNFPLLETLSLEEYRGLIWEDFEPLRGCSNLIKLSLKSTRIPSLVLLEGMKKLKILDLSRCPRVTDLTPLVKCTSLQELYFDHSNFAKVVPLLKSKSLQKISVIGTRLLDIGVGQKVSTRQLKTILISPTQKYVVINRKLVSRPYT